tara:strand:+ start:183 stop:596 length:414 start_codon:yes stop_codon:yes gene_type:complete
MEKTMTPNQMRARAKKLEAEGGNRDLINKLLDNANDAERKAYEAGKKTGEYKKGGKIEEYGGAETYKSKAAMKKHEAKESPAMEKSEKMMGRMAQKTAARAVKGHEKRMHGSKKMATGGSVRGDGVAIRGKTKGRLV